MPCTSLTFTVKPFVQRQTAQNFAGHQRSLAADADDDQIE
jgi:hypothetical protein